ncbi:MAG TPA: membrane dipeptidase, partial [Clostridia bacterium]|nr:membrane dipeptidase [Clostridia bacterium]
RDFYRLGVRYMTLTWMNSTEWAQSSGDVNKDPQTGKLNDPGLTDAGRAIVREMNRLGVMVDVSHVSDRTFYHALTVSRAPVIASHSSSRAITDHNRNLTDDMLVALARNGGVAQVNFNCGFVSNEFIQRARKFRDEHPAEFARYRELNRQYMATHSEDARKELDRMEAQFRQAVPRPPFQALIDHIDHMVKVAGVNHVGIGSDFDGVDCMPEGMDSAADLPKITQALVKLGYSERDVSKILGGNLLRVFGEVERVARQIERETNADRRKEVTLPPAQKQ